MLTLSLRFSPSFVFFFPFVRQDLISNVSIFMTPLEKDLKEYYTPGKGKGERKTEIEQMKQVRPNL